LHRAQLWLGVLPTPGTASFHRGAVLLRFLWRQLRHLQSLAAGTIRDHGTRNRIFFHHFVRTFHCRWVQFRSGGVGQPNGDSRQTSCVHRNCLWDRPAQHSLRSGNSGKTAARLDKELCGAVSEAGFRWRNPERSEGSRGEASFLFHLPAQSIETNLERCFHECYLCYSCLRPCSARTRLLVPRVRSAPCARRLIKRSNAMTRSNWLLSSARIADS